MIYIIYSLGMISGLLYVVYITYRDRLELKELLLDLDSDETQDFALDYLGFAIVTTLMWWVVIPRDIYKRWGRM